MPGVGIGDTESPPIVSEGGIGDVSTVDKGGRRGTGKGTGTGCGVGEVGRLT
jgi:hypothetical protein